MLFSALFAVYFSSSVNADDSILDVDYNIEQSYDIIDIEEYNRDDFVIFQSDRSVDFTIVSQPENYYGFIGDIATFSIVVTGSDNITYQWQYYRDGVWRNSNAESATTSNFSLEITERRVNDFYRCIVSDGESSVSSHSVRIVLSETLSFSQAVSWLGANVFNPILSIVTPWGITFGALIVGIFGAPLLVKAYKKFF